MRLIDADRLREFFETESGDQSYKFIDLSTAFKFALRTIDKAPTIDPDVLRPQWISVAERMPEENVSVLATVSGIPSTNVTLYKTVVIAEYFGNEGWYVEEWPDWEDASPDYWMPLPEPYEPEEDK